MLLRGSSNAVDTEVELRDAIDGDDAGVEFGAELLAFAESAHRLDDELVQARAALTAVVGAAGTAQAAMTSAVFRGLNITADATGIPIDSDWASFVAETSSQLGTDRFASAANSLGTPA